MLNNSLLFKRSIGGSFKILTILDHGTALEMANQKETLLAADTSDNEYVIVSIDSPLLGLSRNAQLILFDYLYEHTRQVNVYAFVDAIIDNQWNRAKLYAHHMGQLPIQHS